MNYDVPLSLAFEHAVGHGRIQIETAKVQLRDAARHYQFTEVSGNFTNTLEDIPVRVKCDEASISDCRQEQKDLKFTPAKTV